MSEQEIQESRKYKREKLQSKVELRSLDKKEKILGSTFDISQGGMKIFVNRELSNKEYIILLYGKKIPARIVYYQRKKGIMVEQSVYIYGFQFQQPITREQAKVFVHRAHPV